MINRSEVKDATFALQRRLECLSTSTASSRTRLEAKYMADHVLGVLTLDHSEMLERLKVEAAEAQVSEWIEASEHQRDQADLFAEVHKLGLARMCEWPLGVRHNLTTFERAFYELVGDDASDRKLIAGLFYYIADQVDLVVVSMARAETDVEFHLDALARRLGAVNESEASLERSVRTDHLMVAEAALEQVVTLLSYLDDLRTEHRERDSGTSRDMSEYLAYLDNDLDLIGRYERRWRRRWGSRV